MAVHIAFFPFMTPGHTIPMLDIASLFSARGVKTTFITTPLNAPNISQFLQTGDSTINLEILPFSTQEAGLPDGVENFESIASFDMAVQLLKAVQIMKDPLEKFLARTRTHCLVADMFFPFATEIAAKFGIPRLVFHGTSFFAVCVRDALMKYEPQKNVSSDDEYFAIPHFPHEIKLTKLQIPQEGNDGDFSRDLSKLLRAVYEAELKSYGVLFNSFCELESDYVDYFRKELGRRGWHIGPVSLCNRHNIEDKSRRGKMASIDKDECFKWLDSKKPNSVIYVCFGSINLAYSPLQLYEIAMALEASGLDFIWVVKTKGKEEEEWLPKGFEKRVKNKGLIIRGWAPQVLILDHEATGGFVTHCGWNSTLESISAGVPMVTWPMFAEQFSNEKHITDVLKIGVPVGSKGLLYRMGSKDLVLREEIEAAIKRLVAGQEGLEMRSRAKKLKEMAYKAVEEGGSSFCELSALIQEIRHYYDDDTRAC